MGNLLLSLIILVVSIIDYPIYQIPDSGSMYLNSYLGWAQYNFINNYGFVAYTSTVFFPPRDHGYNSSPHGFIYNPYTNMSVDVYPSTDDRYNYYITAFNDRGDYYLKELKKNDPDSRPPNYYYSLNNSGSYLTYYNYNYCSLHIPRSSNSVSIITFPEDTTMLYLNDNHSVAGYKGNISTNISSVKISNLQIEDSRNYSYTESVYDPTGIFKYSVPIDFNNYDEMVGWNVTRNGHAEAFLWDSDNNIYNLGLTAKFPDNDIFHPADYIFSSGINTLLINDAGLIASMTDKGLFLFKDQQWIDLSPYLKQKLFPNDPWVDWIYWGQDIQLVDFSNAGMLLYNEHSSENYLFVLDTSIPEPCTIIIFGLGFIFIRKK